MEFINENSHAQVEKKFVKTLKEYIEKFSEKLKESQGVDENVFDILELLVERFEK